MKGAAVTATRDRVVVTYTFATGCQRGPRHPRAPCVQTPAGCGFRSSTQHGGLSCHLREVLHVWVKCGSLSGFPLVPFFPGCHLSSAKSTLFCAPSAVALLDGP